MGVKQQFADTRTAQESDDDVVSLTVPRDIADELGITGGDEVLWTSEEGEDTATIHAPRRN